jgi:hypothetical protein
VATQTLGLGTSASNYLQRECVCFRLRRVVWFPRVPNLRPQPHSPLLQLGPAAESAWSDPTVSGNRLALTIATLAGML